MWTSQSTICTPDDGNNEKQKRETLLKNVSRCIVVLIAVIGLTYSIFEITKEYLQDNNIVSVNRLTSDVSVDYPAVTICSTSPYKCSAVINYNYTRMSHLIIDGKCKDFLHQTKPIMWRQDYVSNSMSHIKKPGTDEIYEDVNKYIYHDMQSSQVENFTLSYEDIIHACSFDGKKCDESDFLMTLSNKRGKCYTFNSAWSQSNGKLKYVPKSKRLIWGGANHAFMIKFKINRSEVIPALSNGIGIRITVHDRHHRPVRLDRNFVTVESRKYSYIGMKKRTREKLKTSDCRNEYDEEIKEMFKASLEPQEKYDSAKCQNFVIQQTAMKNCNCRMNSFIGYEDFPEMTDCWTKLSCVLNITWVDYIEKRCDHPCGMESYDLTVTTKELPISRRFSDESNDSLDDIEDIHKYSTGWINIFYETPDTFHYREFQRFTILSMIGNYGGYIGLFVGVSVISVLNCIDYLWEKIRKRHSGRDKVTVLKHEKQNNGSECYY